MVTFALDAALRHPDQEVCQKEQVPVFQRHLLFLAEQYIGLVLCERKRETNG